MPWLLLVAAGLLEVLWAAMLPATHGFTRLVPSLVLAGALAASMVLLAVAARHIPLGTAYAVWVGIGTVGAAVVGIVAYGEPTSAGRIAFLSLLIIAIVGLKATSAA